MTMNNFKIRNLNIKYKKYDNFNLPPMFACIYLVHRPCKYLVTIYI